MGMKGTAQEMQSMILYHIIWWQKVAILVGSIGSIKNIYKEVKLLCYTPETCNIVCQIYSNKNKF